MPEVVYPTVEEKERLNLSVPAGTRERLIGLAGGERSLGTFLAGLVDQVAAAAPAREAVILDVSTIRQIVDSAGISHDEALPSVAMKKRGVGGKVIFGIVLWVAGKPIGLRFDYDDRSLGWAASNVAGSVLSQALGHLSSQGWTLDAQQDNLLMFSRPRVWVTPSAN